MNAQIINLNITPGKVLPRAHASQYDIGRLFTFYLYDENGIAYSIPSGSTVTIEGTKPDGTGYAYNADSYTGNAVTYTLKGQETVLCGDIPGEIVITKNSNRLGTLNFFWTVEESALSGDTDVSDTEIPAIIDAAAANAQRAEDAATDAIAAKNAAVSAKDDAVSAKNAAVSAKNDAVSAKTDAQTAASTATSAKDDAVAAKNTAVSARDDAVTAKQNANIARAIAVAAKDDAVSAKNDAVSAASAAAGSASDAADAVTTITTMIGATTFTVDFTTGELMYTNDTTWDFSINYTTGNLEWEVAS
jgi:hypothetical protein